LTPLRDNSRMTDPLPTAEAVRRACIEAALAAYEDAGISGLCAEGRWEAAVSAMQSLDLKRLPGAGHAAGTLRAGSGNAA
jgi:hypothetical protein